MGRLLSLIVAFSIVGPFVAAADHVDTERRTRLQILLHDPRPGGTVPFTCRAASAMCDEVNSGALAEGSS